MDIKWVGESSDACHASVLKSGGGGGGGGFSLVLNSAFLRNHKVLWLWAAAFSRNLLPGVASHVDNWKRPSMRKRLRSITLISRGIALNRTGQRSCGGIAERRFGSADQCYEQEGKEPGQGNGNEREGTPRRSKCVARDTTGTFHSISWRLRETLVRATDWCGALSTPMVVQR